MASLRADVRIEYCHEAGSLKTVQTGKGITLKLQWAGARRKLTLLIDLPQKQVSLPLQPPLMMTTSRIAEGFMALQLPKARLHVTENPLTIQVMLSKADPSVLDKMRTAVDMCMARILRKPLHPLSQNTSQMSGSQQSMKRKADTEAGRSMSKVSAGSRGALGGAVTSTLRPPQDGEELLPLTAEQQRIVDLVVAGKNVFFTGCAGTGKSLVIKHIIQALHRDTTYITASTGLAACTLGGTTLHAFAGVGRATDVTAAVRAASRQDARQRWCRASTLIVDEVSMVDGDFFDLLEEVARKARQSEKPFGGLQIVLSGDFHQLPPVAKGRKPQHRHFCFEASTWTSCITHCLQLTHVFRQADMGFVDLLAKIRSGRSGTALADQLQQQCKDPLNMEGIEATKLFTHREDVDLLNTNKLGALPGEVMLFSAQDAGSSPEVLQTGCPARATLGLKIGAQVMLIRNISHSRGLVNGARGVVERWVGRTNRLPVVRFANGQLTTIGKEKWTVASGSRIVATRVQIPLDLGWAISVHKSQGLTLDAVQINLERAFEPGMAYVALSRVKSLEGLQIVGRICARALEAHPKVVAFYANLEQAVIGTPN